MRAQGLFGTSLPCCEDGSCEYGKAWEDVRDPDNCPDLLVGSYTQAHVESARTYYERDSSGGTDRSPRVVVLDEFPGEAFTNDLGPEAFDFATWLARSLRGDIDDRRDMFDADLYSDDWVRAWLEGTIGENPDFNSDSDNDDPILAEVERVIQSLSRVGELLDARDSATEILSEYRGAVEELGVAGILAEFVDGTTPEDEVYRALEDLTEKRVDSDLQGISEWIVRDVHEPLARATDSGTEPADAGIQTADTDLPIGGDLASLLEGAVDAANTRGDAARERIRAALEYDSEVANAYLEHMSADQTMQVILRFARGDDGGATVVARTSALRDDLPVVGRGDIVETWSETATKIVRKARSLGREFTSADVRPAVEVKSRQVRRVLGELVDTGYLAREDGGPGRAHSYERIDDPGAGEVSIPDRDEAVPETETPGRSSSNTYYTANVRVFAGDRGSEDDSTPPLGTYTRAPPAPGTIKATGPPG